MVFYFLELEDKQAPIELLKKKSCSNLFKFWWWIVCYRKSPERHLKIFKKLSKSESLATISLQRWIFLFIPVSLVPGLFSSSHAVIFKSGVLCRNIGQEHSRVTQTCGFNDMYSLWPQVLKTRFHLCNHCFLQKWACLKNWEHCVPPIMYWKWGGFLVWSKK